MEKILLFAATAALLTTTSAQAWNLAQCSSTELARRARYVEQLRGAESNAAAYVPKPFPQSNAHIVEDFFYQFRYLRSVQKPEQITPADKALLSLMNSSQLGVEVIRIENWRGSRCLGARDGDQKFLLRLSDKTTSGEIARAWLEDSGLLGVMAYRDPKVDPAWWSIPIPSLGETTNKVAAIVGHKLVDAQYVTTYGRFQCDPLLPCVAMRSPSTGTTYLANDLGEIVAVTTNAKRFSRGRDLAKVEDISGASRQLPPNQKLMSLGGDAYVAVETIR